MLASMLAEGSGGWQGGGVKCDIFLLNPIVTSGSIAAETSRQEDFTEEYWSCEDWTTLEARGAVARLMRGRKCRISH